MVNGLKNLLEELRGFVTAHRASSPNIAICWRQCKAALEAMTKGATITFCKNELRFIQKDNVSHCLTVTP